jgi:hypothetical protein
MVKRKDLLIVALATFCLTASLFMVGTIRSAGIGEWNPWADLNNDGVVDIFDAILLANAYGKNGTRLMKPSVLYDSGWVNITNKAGQDINFSHGLGVLDWNDEGLIVEVTGKTTSAGELLRYLGLQQLQAWNKTYGGSEWDDARSIVSTTDGGYAIVGDTHSFGAGNGDFWLVKIDSFGNVQWNMTYGGAGYDEAFCVVQTTDGGYALAGDSDSFGDGDQDFWLVKTDSSGNQMWNKTYGKEYGDFATSIVQTTDGGYALAGYSQSLTRSSDFWLVKTDAEGNCVWNKTYGGAGIDYAYALLQTAEGGYALAGEIGVGSGYSNVWLVKTDPDGNQIWNRTYGGGGHAHALIRTSDGGYAIAGSDGNMYLVKTDSNGNLVWNKTYEAHVSAAFALIQAADGGYALAGHIMPSGYVLTDFWLVKTDADGNCMWNKTYAREYGDEAHAMVQINDGGYVLAGTTGTSLVGGYTDFWVVKTNPDGNSVDGESGLVWVGSTKDMVILYRGEQDIYWNFVRVRIIRVSE